MNILVSGATGFIGSHTCVSLLENGHKVIAFDNFYNSKEDVINSINKIVGNDVFEGFKFYNADMTNPEDMEKIFNENSIDCVIHFAGYKAVGESVQMPLNYYYNNIYGTLCLLDSMKKHNVKRLIFSSSATVYGSPEALPIKESFSLSATNPYGRTKLMIEEILRDLYVSDSDWSIVLLRYFNPVGAHKSGLLCEDPKGIPNNLMPRLLDVLFGKTGYITVFGNDYNTKDGTGVRDYIHVWDLAYGHVKAIDYAMNNKGAEAINLGTGCGYSVMDLIKSLEKASGKEIPFKICPRRAGDIDACYADPSKASELLNWSATLSVEDMCLDAYNARKNLEEWVFWKIRKGLDCFYILPEFH